jgi:hypothetical protein
MKPGLKLLEFRLFSLIIAGIFLGLTMYAADEAQPSRSTAMQKILEQRKAGFELKTDGLKKLHYEDLKEVEKLTKFEKYRLPPPVGSDVFSYEVWRAPETDCYLIIKTGGEAGVLEVYGVGCLEKRTATR